MKETFSSILEKYIIKSFPIVQAFDGIEKHEHLLLKYGYLVVFNGNQYIGIITPYDLLKRQNKLIIDCCNNCNPIDYNSGIHVVFNKIKEQNTNILPVFRDNMFYGILIFIHMVEQLFTEFHDLSKKISESEKEIEFLKNKSLVPEQIKQEFLNSILHEFRTPANAIVGFSEMVNSNAIDEERRQYFLNIVRSSTYQLLKLIDDLVEIARVKAGDIKFEYNICSIDNLFSELIIELSRTNKKLGKELTNFEFKIGENVRDHFFTSDKYRIKQVLGFLVDNAVKFSDQKKITIGCEIYNSNKIEFFVNDKGKGIPANDISEILKGFHKIEDENLKTQPGLGLGIAISHKIVTLMGGELGINSNDTEGTTVYFSLPVSAK